MQWGQPIGKHEAVAQKIAQMAANTFAMEADRPSCRPRCPSKGGYDIRLEAAIAKMCNTEAGWRIVDDTLQIRGGRGYETAESLRARGEQPIPIERAMRDFRINLIFEGSSEIMRLFIAREAVDHHFKLAFEIVNPESTMKERLAALAKSTPFYVTWYPSRWVERGQLRSYGEFGKLATHVRYIERTHAPPRPLDLPRDGALRAQARAQADGALPRRRHRRRAVRDVRRVRARAHACASRASRKRSTLADAFCREARDRIKVHFDNLFGPNDAALYKVAMQVLRGEHAWLEQGIVSSLAHFDKTKRRPTGSGGAVPDTAAVTAKVGATQ